MEQEGERPSPVTVPDPICEPGSLRMGLPLGLNLSVRTF